MTMTHSSRLLEDPGVGYWELSAGSHRIFSLASTSSAVQSKDLKDPSMRKVPLAVPPDFLTLVVKTFMIHRASRA